MPAPNAIGQRLHAGDHRGRQGGQQHRRPVGERRASTPGERRLEHEREGRQTAGDHPHDRREPADRDAEQQGPVGVLGRRPHGDAGVGLRRNQASPGMTSGTTSDDEDLVADQGLDAEVEVEAERDLEAALAAR